MRTLIGEQQKSIMHSHYKAYHRLKVHNVPFKLVSSVSGYVREKSHEIKKILVGGGAPSPTAYQQKLRRYKILAKTWLMSHESSLLLKILDPPLKSLLVLAILSPT